MPPDLISIATRREFREILTGFILSDIESIFSGAGLVPNLEYEPPIGGQRRSLVEQYYANITFSNVSDIRKLLSAYEELLFQLEYSVRHNPDATHTVTGTSITFINSANITVPLG